MNEKFERNLKKEFGNWAENLGFKESIILPKIRTAS